jgi:subtilisin family serine protease
MSEKEYIVSLNKGVDYEAFNAEMIATTGAGAIPNRSTTVANARPGSQRNTHYMLTDEEATALESDPRVYGVTLLPKLDDTIAIVPRAVQQGDFTKTTLDRGDFINWGLRRINEATNPYDGLSVTGGYNYTLDGTGVDIVIQDSGIQADHPEFNDAQGASRVQQIDWYTASGLSGSMPANHYTDTDGHGTHVAGITAGLTYGWAKNARIYAVQVEGLGPNGIPAEDCFDVIKEWHNNKPVDPETGYKRPTIVNMSWGYAKLYDSVALMTYRGDSYTGTQIDEQNERWALGLVPASGFNGYTYAGNLRITSVDVDVQELVDAGVHVCIAAGNRYHKIDVPGGDDYDNVAAANTGSFYYHRGSSPSSEDAIIVGNIDSAEHSGGLEQKAASSECGPGVDVYAPGTDIMSAMSQTNVFTDGPYPGDENYLIANISGTSMASPQVAGMMSLYLQLNPNATPAQAKAFITSTAKEDQIYETGSSTDYTDTRSLLGSENKFLFNKFNSATKLRIGN